MHRFETANNKHSVHFGRDLNNPKNTRQFTKISAAKQFAVNKARKIGVKTVLMDLPSGSKEVKVPMRNKRATIIQRRTPTTSLFDFRL